MNDRSRKQPATARWELWNLRALMPQATTETLGDIHRRRAELESVQQKLRRGDARLIRDLFVEAGAFYAAHPEIRQGLIVTMHMGPYSLLPGLYLASGIEPAVVLDSRALQSLQSVAERQQQALGLPGTIRWITTGRPYFVGRILKALRAGRPVLVYLDGNSGDGGMEATRERGMPYRLPGRTIRIRTGLGRLIRRTGCAVVGVTVRWNRKRTLDWRAVSPGFWDGGASSRQITRQLYDWLFDEVARSPEQWGFWSMIAHASDAFNAAEMQEATDPTRLTRLRRRFRNAMLSRPESTRMVMNHQVEVWEPEILADLTDHRFWSAEGLQDEDLDPFRRGAAPTLCELTAACGRVWVEFHAMRLVLLGVLELRDSA